jgi:diaminopimelate epimerase
VLGNTYLVTEQPGLTPRRVRDAVGDADGILELTRSGATAADVVIWNPDGSRAELSGNGTRIAAGWLFERSSGREATITVGTRKVTVRTLVDGSVEQELGAYAVEPPEVVDGIVLVPVDVGNPHAVVEGDPAEIASVGPKLALHPRFPRGTNVQVARVKGPGEVVARVWERGVGETAASGTSAVAVAAATHGEGEVLVRFPGGDLRVRLEAGHAWVTGPPATRVDSDRTPGGEQSAAREDAKNRHGLDRDS